MRTIKITKLKEVENPTHPNNKEVGYEKEGIFIAKPKVGQHFIMQQDNGKLFITSKVVEVIDKFTFKTKNSIYRYAFK